jgi:hypothetical protein
MPYLVRFIEFVEDAIDTVEFYMRKAYLFACHGEGAEVRYIDKNDKSLVPMRLEEVADGIWRCVPDREGMEAFLAGVKSAQQGDDPEHDTALAELEPLKIMNGKGGRGDERKASPVFSTHKT